MSDPDYATWLTKQQAADAIGVTTKSVERFVQAGQIQQARWQRAGRGPLLAVYEPTDVARIAAARQPGPLAPFLMPTSADVPTNGNGHRATELDRVPGALSLEPFALSPGQDLLTVLVTAAMRIVSETSQTSSAAERSAYVDKTEALAIAGVSYGALRAAVQAGEVKQRGRRYRRQDLEQL